MFYHQHNNLLSKALPKYILEFIVNCLYTHFHILRFKHLKMGYIYSRKVS